MTRVSFRQLAATLLLLPSLAAAENPTLRVCYESDYFPPYFNGKDEVPKSSPGLVIEHLLLPAAHSAGFEVALYRRPWNRCMHDMQNNLTDAILPAAWTPERESWGRFPGPERDRAGGVDPRYADWAVNYQIIVAHDSRLTWDGQRFGHLQQGVGAPLGHLSSQRLQQLGALRSGNLRPETALNMIVRQRLDGYVLEALIARAFINKAGLQEQLTVLPTPLFKTDWYVPVTHTFYAAHGQQVWRFWEQLVRQRQLLEASLRRQLETEAAQAAPLP